LTWGSGAARPGPGEGGGRLDIFISSHTGISRSRAQKLIGEGRVLVDGTPARKNHVMACGEEVTWEMPPPEPEDIVGEHMDLDIVYEDADIVVIDKPAELVMYPGPGHPCGTLLNGLLERYPDIEGVGGRGRPGVFHRLDRGTSGLVAVARSERAYNAMVALIQERRVERTYIALVVGSLPAETGTIDAPVGRSRSNRKRMAVDQYGGKPAISRFKVAERFDPEFTLVEVSLETGRTHQIRVHFAHIGHPVAGDPEYSRGRSARQLGLRRQFLHALRLAFPHPVTGASLSLSCEPPEDLTSVLEALRTGR
jgi:23S rRNA pseudouridine1911/1915/1917 synthase